MSTPFTREPGWDYIVSESDRAKFAPKLATDEVFNGKWFPIHELYANDRKFNKELVYRRRLVPEPVAPTDGWVEFAKEKPKAGERVWLYDPYYQKRVDLDCVVLTRYLPVQSPQWTHWKRAEVPAPPMVLSQEDRDWEEAGAIVGRLMWALPPEPTSSVMMRDLAKTTYLAGLRSGRAKP